MTRKLLSLPISALRGFHDWSGLSREEWFVGADPEGERVGSGGGTAHLLVECWREQTGAEQSFSKWLEEGVSLVVHAGGQSRRTPAYAAAGKALIPVPVFRWARGQRLSQTLLDLQMPLIEKFAARATTDHRLVVASGDVLVLSEAVLPPLPDADIVCLGLWSDAETVSRHGVFFVPRGKHGNSLSFMLQKPDVATINRLSEDHLFLLDIGIWMLGRRAVMALMERCGWDELRGEFTGGRVAPCDLYSEFGTAMGACPSLPNPEIGGLRCAVVPLDDGEFYHFGRTSDLVASSLALQNRIRDQRVLATSLVKPHPSLFVQNSLTAAPLEARHSNIWIENSHLGARWSLQARHVVTGVPANDWAISLPAGLCLDICPVVGGGHAIRFHGYDDEFRGPLGQASTQWCGEAAARWFADRRISLEEAGLDAEADIFDAALFPVMTLGAGDDGFLQWLLDASVADGVSGEGYRARYLGLPRVSCADLLEKTDLPRLFAQRAALRAASLPALARHWRRSVFCQIDLLDAAEEFAATAEEWAAIPDPPSQDTDPLAFAHERMFRAAVLRRRKGPLDEVQRLEGEAFAALRSSFLERAANQRQCPRNTSLAEQIIWARSPVRLDLAGGWTDTPPYCLIHGGSVVNFAAELNGQPPIQAFARICREPHLVMRSIDLGVECRVETWDELSTYADVGSGFAIAKAALALAGFHPDFGLSSGYSSLRAQLEDFGGGIELSLLAAVPKGSGLGTSSILAATLLGALGNLCGLGWDQAEICFRVLVLEQMLTTGGGWQDQYGGVLHGIKWLKTQPGYQQVPEVRWLPEHLFRSAVFRECALLYYTGITRVAKSILAEIVRGMFLNSSRHLPLLEELGHHAVHTYETLLREDWRALGEAVAETWRLNTALDSGANPAEVQRILAMVSDWTHGAKLLGAGGGGYLLLLAKDPEAAALIRATLESNPPNAGARFVDLSISSTGLQVTRS